MKFLFIGNRQFVLEEMLRLSLNISDVLVVKGSYLEAYLTGCGVGYTLINSKSELINKINTTNFDVLISNGCPYILPISELPNKLYVNIHPSFLPDLRGADPVIGSILFQRDSGATCHIMNNEIDGGDIISQVKIPYSKDLDVSLLYQLSFLVEKEVFIKALKGEFKVTTKQHFVNDLIYFTRLPENKIITFQESNQEIINKVKAFNNKSQGCTFFYNNRSIKVYSVEVLHNDYLKEYAVRFNNLQIMLSYEDSIVFKKDGQLLRLYRLNGQVAEFKIFSYLKQVSHEVLS